MWGFYSLIVNHLYFLVFFDLIPLVYFYVFISGFSGFCHFWFGGFTNVYTVGLGCCLVAWWYGIILKFQSDN